MAKVTTPMTVADIHTLTCKKAIEMPTAKASMLVAIAITSMVRMPKSPSCSSSSPHIVSRIILAPMSESKPKAIQWSTLTT